MKNPMRHPIRRAIFAWLAQAWERDGTIPVATPAVMARFAAEHPGLRATGADWDAAARAFYREVERERIAAALREARRCPFCHSRRLDIEGSDMVAPPYRGDYDCPPRLAVVCRTCGAHGPDVRYPGDFDDPYAEAVRRWNGKVRP